MSELPACEVCGSKSFHKVSGFYVCTNCDTQSQEVQVQLFDYSTNLRIDEDDEEREEVVTQKIEKDRNLTSWEMLNLSLKRIIEQLINLGESPELKVVAFQLWATVLQKSNVAFFSKHEDKLPPLPLGFKNTDAEILYGVHDLRKQLFKEIKYFKRKPRLEKVHQPTGSRDAVDLDSTSTTSNSSAETRVSLKSLRHKQRKLALTELNESSVHNESVISQDESLHTLLSEKLRNTKKRKIVTFKSSGQKTLRDMLLTVKRAKDLSTTDPLFKKIRNAIENRLNQPRLKPDSSSDLVLTFNTVVSVVRTALYLTSSDIQLGDLMRWFGEGHISYSVNNALNSDIKNPEQDEIKNKLGNREGFEKDMRILTISLSFNSIPPPDLYKLVKRYCTELCLPCEFVSYVHGIMNFLPPKMSYEDFNYRKHPDYECRVLAYIAFSLKLLFSLDGVTERKQSEFADYVNKSHSRNPELPFLFSWNAWVQYIQCRKAILSKYDPAINNLAYQGRIDNKHAYINQWEQRKAPYHVYTNLINEVFLSTTCQSLQKAIIENDSILDIKFPASLTPQSTYITHLLDNYPNLIEHDTRTVLENKFTNYSILHLLDINRCNDIAAMCNATVEFVDGSAEVDAKVYEQNEDDRLFGVSKSRTVPAYAPTRVEVVEPENNRKRKSNLIDHKCKTFKYTYETFSDPKPPPKKKNFKIYKPASKYWFFHEFNRTVTNEGTLDLAEESLSESFRWLIKELGDMVFAEFKNLYLELISIESVYYGMFEDEDTTFVDRCPFKLFAAEW